MGAFLSFVGGAAKQFVSTVEKTEEDAKEMAKSSFNGLYKRYEENAEANRELTNKMKAEKQYIETVWSGATPEQVNELLANPVALEAIKKTKNPSSISLDNYIRVIKGNESKATAAERAAALPTLVEQAKQKLQPLESEKRGGSPIGAFFRDIGKDRMESDMAQFAKSQGLTLEEMRSSAKMARPVGSAEFDMGVLQESPGSMDEIIKKGEVTRFQAGQKFGKDSDQYKQADAVVKAAEEEVVKTDKNQEARAERLMLERLDTKDPARIAEIDEALKATRASILNHKKLTSIKDPKEKEATYNAMKTEVNDYVNTRMRDIKGTKWRDMVDFKTYTDEATGKTITSKTTKVAMTPEQQQEMFAVERKLTAQALKENGYVLSDGTPRTPVAERLMRNFNIKANDLADEQAQPEKPLSMANDASTKSTMPAPKTQAEYDAIPPNTEYMDTDGKIKRKGGK